MPAALKHPEHVKHPPSVTEVGGWVEDAAIAMVFVCGAAIAAVIILLLILL